MDQSSTDDARVIPFHQAVALYRAGRLEEAGRLCAQIFAADPTRHDAFHLGGIIAARAGDGQRAARLISEAISLKPNNAEYHFHLGLAHESLSRFAEAAESYRRATDLRQDFFDGYVRAGEVHLRANNPAAALQSFAHAAQVNPQSGDADHRCGLILYDLGRFEDAIVRYDAAIAVRPDVAEFHMNRGAAQRKLRHLSEAGASFDRAIALRPDFALAWTNRGVVLRELGHIGDALASFDHAIALDQAGAAAHLERAITLQDLDRPTEARVAVERALACDATMLEAKKFLFWLILAEGKESDEAERLTVEIARELATAEAQRLRIDRTILDFRLLHDLEQVDHLRAAGTDAPIFDRAGAVLAAIQSRQSGEVAGRPIALTQEEADAIAQLREQAFRYPVPALTGSALNPDKDWKAVEEQYFGGGPEIIAIDDFLSPEALSALQTFCMRSTIWRRDYDNYYLGAFGEGGFVTPVHLRIAAELQEKMPRIFGPHRLQQVWAFKYTASQLEKGINVHADMAHVNLNFWIAPDEANLDPESGGLVVYDVPSPRSWRFNDYNRNPAKIYAFLAENKAQARVVPHRCNRAVLFNSDLFHETDKIRFRPGYANRRINITYLFGRGLKD